MMVVKLEMFLLKKAGAMDSVSFCIMPAWRPRLLQASFKFTVDSSSHWGEEEEHTVSDIMVNHQEE